MKKIFLAATMLLLGGLASPAAYAQPGSTGPTPGTPPTDPTAVPLDGGASLLLASGVALGVRKLRQRRQRQAS